MAEWLIGDVSLLGVHVQNWMLVVTASFVFGSFMFGYSGNSVGAPLEDPLQETIVTPTNYSAGKLLPIRQPLPVWPFDRLRCHSA